MESTLSKIKLNRSFFLGTCVPNTHPPNIGPDAPPNLHFTSNTIHSKSQLIKNK